MGAAYNQQNNDVGLKSLRSTVLGGSLDLGPGKVSALYGQIKDDNPSGVSQIAALVTPGLGAAAPIWRR